MSIAVKGLCGGHSGVEIHLGRANAIKCVVEAVRALGDGAVGTALLLLLSPAVSTVGTTYVKKHGAGVSSALLNRNGMIIGAIGTFLGAVIGFVLCGLLKKYKFIELPGDVYYLTTLPVKLDIMDVIIIATSALVICFLATLYPASQASKLDPVEAIRYG